MPTRADALSAHNHGNPANKNVKPHPRNKRRPLGDKTDRSGLLTRHQPWYRAHDPAVYPYGCYTIVCVNMSSSVESCAYVLVWNSLI